MNAILRVARPTDDLERLLPFYTNGLDFQVLAAFEDHEGFDGVMLGLPGAPYHLEFTRCRHHSAGRAPTQDNLLIFYLPEEKAWSAACRRMSDAGFQPAPSFNPYWDVKGKTFEDPDGYRIVLQNSAWPAN